MEIPEEIHPLIEGMSAALLEALKNDPTTRDFAAQIQSHGWEVTVLLEATIALHRRNASTPYHDMSFKIMRPEELSHSESSTWSDEDKAFLKTFRIRLD